MRVVRTLSLLLAVACAVDGKSSAKMMQDTKATKKLAAVRIPEGHPPGVLPNAARRRRFRSTALVQTGSDAPTFVVRGITADRCR
jgi:hypothetical protein